MKKRYWFWFGIIFVIINIVLSFIALNDPDISSPHDFSGLKVIMYPNILLGLPVSGIVKDLTINFFIVLSIYWFIIGSLIGLWYGRLKSKSGINKKHYWLRGGSVALLIAFLCVPFMYSSRLFSEIFFFPANVLHLNNLPMPQVFIYPIILNAFVYFVLGSFLGLFYGKIKNRNKFI